MTTYTLTGLAVYRNLATDDVNGVDSTDITLDLVVPESTTSLSYSVNPAQPGDQPGDETIDIAVDDYTLRIAGMTVGNGTPIDPEVAIFEVVWTDAANIGFIPTKVPNPPQDLAMFERGLSALHAVV